MTKIIKNTDPTCTNLKARSTVTIIFPTLLYLACYHAQNAKNIEVELIKKKWV